MCRRSDGCNFIGADYYGKLSQGWKGDGTPGGSLRPWLDPLDSGATSLRGFDPNRTNETTPVPVMDRYGWVLLVILLTLGAALFTRRL